MTVFLLSMIIMSLNIVKKNNKYFISLFFLLLWTLWGWNYFNADYRIHKSRYDFYDVASKYTEVFYTKILEIFHFFNIDYQSFLIIFSFIWLFTFFFILKKWSKFMGFALGMTFVYPFSMMVTTQRYSMGLLFSLIGLFYLINKKNMIGFTIFTILASLIHFSFLFNFMFIICLLPIAPSFLMLAVGMSNVLIYFVHEMIGIVNFDFLGTELSTKIELFLSNSTTNATDFTLYTFKIIYLFLGFTILMITQPKSMENEEHQNVLKLNIISLLAVGLMFYSKEFFRFQYQLIIVNSITLSNLLFGERKGEVSKNNLIFEISCLTYNFGNLYLWVLMNDNINTVFLPIFKNNLLWK